jgi:cyclic pyranopterin phosphate synthase
MPAEIFGETYEFLPKPEILTFEEITRIARLFVQLGVGKIRITGGEPLLRRELDRLITALKRIEGVTDLTLTTNGFLLEQMAEPLKRAGLDRLTVSLDSLDEKVFERMNGRDYGLDRVLKGISKAEGVGFHPLKINAVVQRGVNDHTITELAKHFHGTGHILRFIEFMDVGTRNKWDLSEVVSGAEMVERIGKELPLEPFEPNYPGEVAKRFRYLDGGGEIGIITSVTQPFCGECSRARLSTDGNLFTCLFAEAGMDLRAPLRGGASDDEISKMIQDNWLQRTDRYSELRSGAPGTSRKVEMYQIGG